MRRRCREVVRDLATAERLKSWRWSQYVLGNGGVIRLGYWPLLMTAHDVLSWWAAIEW